MKYNFLGTFKTYVSRDSGELKFKIDESNRLDKTEKLIEKLERTNLKYFADLENYQWRYANILKLCNDLLNCPDIKKSTDALNIINKIQNKTKEM